MQKFISNLIPIIVLGFPAIIGAAVYFFKYDKAVSWVESVNGWFLRKKESVSQKTGIVSRWFFRPVLWVLAKIMEMTEQTKDQYLRTAIRIASYLYFIGIALYISISIVVGIAILVIALWIIGELLSGDSGTSYTTQRTVSRVSSGEYKTTPTCKTCSNYQHRDWSINYECKLGHDTPDFDDTKACNDYEG